MLAASPKRLGRRVLPALLVVFYGCSDPSAPASPRVELRAPSLDVNVVKVTNTDDSGPGSLRQAIADAPDGSVIQFDASIAGKTIVTDGLFPKNHITIEGPLPAGITISGGLRAIVFAVGDGADVTLRNLSIVDGRNGIGGGIDVLRARLLLDHVLVANNEAVEDGGGIMAADNAILTVVNSTISGNVAPNRGGAIVVSDESDVTIRNSTIANNTSAPLTGAIAADASRLSIRNTILGNFETGGNCNFAQDVAVTFVGTNLSDDITCGSSGVTLGNALLKPLANNGGPTRTHAIDIASAAVDAGTLCTESTDQRYVARPAGTSCDVGAFEFNDYGTFKFTIGPNISVNPKTGVATVTGTIACSKLGGATTVSIAMSQTQKSTGRFTTIVQGTGGVTVASCSMSPASWSTTIMPGSGKFESGNATASVSTVTIPPGFIQGSASATVKIFFVK
jgi:hypothetical protein